MHDFNDTFLDEWTRSLQDTLSNFDIKLRGKGDLESAFADMVEDSQKAESLII